MLLDHFSDQASAEIAAPADAVFAALTDVDRLPEWNARIARVIEPLPRPLEPGVEWVVKIQLATPPASWPSRATCTTYDARARRFAHVSVSDDGNPSHADWDWRVVPLSDTGSRVEVSWVGHPKTFWRRLLFARMRRTQLRTETAGSLAALGRLLADAPQAGPTPPSA
jgi:uncharacterized protein YndB with AHSA1/START domain